MAMPQTAARETSVRTVKANFGPLPIGLTSETAKTQFFIAKR